MNHVAGGWIEANQQYLTAALNSVRIYLQTSDSTESLEVRVNKAERELLTAAESMSAPPALERLTEEFGLTRFERNLLLLCAGMELDTQFAAQCAAKQDNQDRPFPTFALALAVLPEAHWSALLPTSPLRHWRLLNVVVVGAGTLTSAPLNIDERVLHYLRGMQCLDVRLTGLIKAIHHREPLAPSHIELAQNLSERWSNELSAFPVVQLYGSDLNTRASVAVHACDFSVQSLSTVSATQLPNSGGELEAFLRLWEREAVLTGSALLLECNAAADLGLPVIEFIERSSFPLIVSTLERVHTTRALPAIKVIQANVEEQQLVWRRSMPATKLNGELNALIGQFNLSPSQIASIGVSLNASSTEGFVSTDDECSALWNACRLEARPKMDQLAHRIKSSAQWDDLVLPTEQLETLQQIRAQVRQRFKVYEQWGFANKDSRGLGISALFTGSSGTGKTLAAEVLANALELDLYRIDLSQVVSKYIGETEKNLRRLFDAAEVGGAVLLFDECDALFGKRSEVKDSHDRYANIEVSYLLQRMEAYCGLAILTTNMRNAIDQAFLRRIRFVVQFPFPDALHRADIWRRVFPAQVPISEIDPNKLAQLNVTGGNIRNIALGAAFLAAEEEVAVNISHLLRSTKIECIKIDKPLSGVETRGWE